MRSITENQREKLRQLVALEAEYRAQSQAEHEARERQIKLIERLGQDVNKRRSELHEHDARRWPGNELSPRQAAEQKLGEIETRLKDARSELQRMRERQEARAVYLAPLTNTVHKVLAYIRANREEFGVAQ